MSNYVLTENVSEEWANFLLLACCSQEHQLRQSNKTCSVNSTSPAELSRNVTSFPDLHCPTGPCQAALIFPASAAHCHTPSPGDVPPSTGQREDPPQIARLEKRIMAVASELDRFVPAEK